MKFYHLLHYKNYCQLKKLLSRINPSKELTIAAIQDIHDGEITKTHLLLRHDKFYSRLIANDEAAIFLMDIAISLPEEFSEYTKAIIFEKRFLDVIVRHRQAVDIITSIIIFSTSVAKKVFDLANDDLSQEMFDFEDENVSRKRILNIILNHEKVAEDLKDICVAHKEIAKKFFSSGGEPFASIILSHKNTLKYEDAWGFLIEIAEAHGIKNYFMRSIKKEIFNTLSIEEQIKIFHKALIISTIDGSPYVEKILNRKLKRLSMFVNSQSPSFGYHYY